ncbi:hypothetical protein B0H63DRAFT_544223 [Podospora didyma]|uniref:Uncharacterized protein n=1 Tax=Podospora didyma TaxID=330526 RepID=A0AAE0NQM8_9PEZI|nr:hypothetical protein B0H63DRAFT_544223 [Podospora didyma]
MGKCREDVCLYIVMEVRPRAEENERELKNKPLNDRRGVSDSALLARRQAWTKWVEFIKDIRNLDPNETILNLCRGPIQQEQAKLRCQNFLCYYIESSERERPNDGPEEVVHELTVTSTTTVLEMWKALIMYADTNVLQRMRRRDPDNSAQWTLSIGVGGPRIKGPVFEISTWIVEVLSANYNLTNQQKFEKHEAAAEDILLILNTIWYRADLIKTTPDMRLDFCIVLLLAGITSFRPGAITNVYYHQVEMAAVRDPADPAQTKIIATITLTHNKRRAKALRKSQDHISGNFGIRPFRYWDSDKIFVLTQLEQPRAGDSQLGSWA